MITDSNVEEVRRVREELIKRHGGLDGYLKHLQLVERERTRKAKKKPLRSSARTRMNGRRLRRKKMANVSAE